MKKIKLFPKAPNKEVKIGDTIFWTEIALLFVFGFAISHLTKTQSLLCLFVLMILTIIGIYFKLAGIVKQYRFFKKAIANGREVEIGC